MTVVSTATMPALVPGTVAAAAILVLSYNSEKATKLKMKSGRI
jgi:ABC-type Fe3+ transport system permease subunit